MIKTKTVLVLGAGASMPYGLPSGHQLLESLCELQGGTPPRDRIAMYDKLGHTHDDLRKFGRALAQSSVQ